MHQDVALEVQAVPEVSTWAPPRWLNRMMALFLRTPLLERWIGQSIGLITVKGRRSGKLYTTPVTYLRDSDNVIILSKRVRLWWRNLLDNPRTVLRLAGHNQYGIATIMPTDEEALSTMIQFLGVRRRDATAYGLHFDDDGHLDPDQVRAILPQITVIRVKLVPDGENAISGRN